jgi:hypothetical protein
MRVIWLICLVASVLISCNKRGCRTGLEPIDGVDITIIRTEQELRSAKTPEEILAYFSKYTELGTYLWHIDQYPDPSILAERMNALMQNPGVDTVFMQSIEAFEDMSEIEKELEGAFARLKSIFPEVKTPKVYTAVSVFYNDFFVSDSLIIIGIDHFIGPGAKYAPQDIPHYIFKRYDKAHLPAMITQFVSGHFVRTGRESTFLSDMIDFGKTYYLTSRLLPCTPDSILLGFTPRNMADISSNREIIWANFVENQLLYTTDHTMKRRFLSERPNVYEISPDCPGRVGTWVGWEIVEAYMAKNDVSILELLNDTDHHKIFELSRYKPKND